MAKIYEALEEAEKEQTVSGRMSLNNLSLVDFRKSVSAEMVKTLTDLYQNIIVSLPYTENRIIQFISSLEGEGTSPLIREFAKFSALKLKKSVLLLDANQGHSTHCNFFNIKPTWRWENFVSKNKVVKEAFCQIEKTSLFIGQFSMNCDSPATLLELSMLETFFEQIKNDFEMILIDSPAAARCPDSLILVRNMDGVVLIVEAEKTRWQVVESVKNKILAQGGNILGVVLNNRRYPIPDFIYNKI